MPDDVALHTAERLAEGMPPPAGVDTPTNRPGCSLRTLFVELHKLIGNQKYVLLRVSVNDFEARTYGGAVGRGSSPADAIAELIDAVIAVRANAERRRQG